MVGHSVKVILFVQILVEQVINLVGIILLITLNKEHDL